MTALVSAQPAYAIVPGDRSGWAVIASSTALMLVLLFACVRAYTRYPFRSSLLYDDIAIIFSTALAAVQSVLIILASSRGLGRSKTLDNRNWESAQKVGNSSSMPGTVRADFAKLVYASDILCVLAIFGSRIAVLCLEHALSPEHWHRFVVKTGLVLGASMSVAAVVMIAMGCNQGLSSSQVKSKCGELYTRWTVVYAFGVVLEAFIFGIIMRLLFAVQRNWTNKLKATTVFALRLTVIVVATYRLLALRDFRQTSDPMLDRVLVVAWTQGELAYSLTTAMIPSMMPFLTKLNTGLGALSRDDFIQQTQQESGGSFAMQSLSRDATKRTSHSTNKMRADNVGYKSMVVGQAEIRRSISSDDSQKVMVRKTVDVDYSQEQAHH